jgi:hypothetical protein
MQYTGIKCRSVDEATKEIYTFFERHLRDVREHNPFQDPAMTTYDLELIKAVMPWLVKDGHSATASDVKKAYEILGNPCPPSVFNEKKGDRCADLIMEGLHALPALRLRSAVTHALFGDGIEVADSSERELSHDDIQSYLDFVKTLAKIKKVDLKIKPGLEALATLATPKDMVNAAIEQKLRSGGSNLPTLWHLGLDHFRAKCEVCPPIESWATSFARKGSLPTGTGLNTFHISDLARELRGAPAPAGRRDELSHAFLDRMYHQATAGQVAVALSLSGVAMTDTRGAESALWRGVIPFVIDNLYEMTAGVLEGKNAYAPDRDQIDLAYEKLHNWTFKMTGRQAPPDALDPGTLKGNLEQTKNNLVETFANGLTGIISKLPERMIAEHQAAGNKITKTVLDEIRSVTDQIREQVMGPSQSFHQTGHAEKILDSLRDYAEGIIDLPILVQEISENVREAARAYDEEHDMPDDFEQWCGAFVKSVCDDVELEVAVRLNPVL